MRRLKLKRKSAPGNDGGTKPPASTATDQQDSKRISMSKFSPTKKGKFNARQTAFIQHYVDCKNATEAARRAGYASLTADVCGPRMLRIARIRAEVDRLLASQAAKLAVSGERVKAELAKLAFSSMENYVEIGADGQPVFNLAAMTADHAAALQELTVEEFKDGRSDKREVRRIKLKLCDKRGALELLGKHYNLFADKVEHKHTHQHTVLGLLLHEIDEESRGRVIEHEAVDGA